MRLLLALAWLVSAGVGFAAAVRHRAYLLSLPDSPGNNRLRRQRVMVLIVSSAATVIALVNLWLWMESGP